MTVSRNSSAFGIKPLVVATVHSTASLQEASRLRPGAVDLLELRVDAFAHDLALLRKSVGKLKLPLIITVRHPAEGGQNALTVGQRRGFFREFLPLASSIDLELRSMKALADIHQEARERGVRIIASAHHFKTTPDAMRLRAWMKNARAAGADICKIAAQADTVAALQRLLELFAAPAGVPLSVMAMGRFGKISRLLFAHSGSVLNYGYLGTANASGQWPARILRERLEDLQQ